MLYRHTYTGVQAEHICRCKTPPCSAQLLCAQALYLYEGFIQTCSGKLCTADQLVRLDVMDTAFSPVYDEPRMLMLPLIGQICDPAGNRISVRFDLPLKVNHCHMTKGSSGISLSIRLLHARHAKPGLFEICAQIILSQTNLPDTKIEKKNLPLYPKPICGSNGDFCRKTEFRL